MRPCSGCSQESRPPPTPGWSRVLLCPTIEAADRVRRDYSDELDYRQVFSWNEWRNARIGRQPVEVAVDNADLLVAQFIGQPASFVTITGTAK